MTVIARHYQTRLPVRMTTTSGVMQSIDAIELPEDECDSLPWIAPGLFDIQVNGANGIWFSDEQLTVDQVCEVLITFRSHGVARLFPTLITNSAEALEHGFRMLSAARDQYAWVRQMVPGYHLEGPYISPEDGPRGAHPLQHVRGCNWEEFSRWQAAAGNLIRLVTLAPEAEGAVDFVQRFTKTGGVIAIGHTAADTSQIMAAVDAGAKLSTHFGNGAHGTLRRHPNYLWDQLAEPRLIPSLITDGHHIPASVAKSVLLAKGAEHVIVTCDSSGLAGCPPGEYAAAGGRCEVLDDGRIVVAGQRQFLAGSGAFTEECVAGMRHLTGIDLPTAWNMAHRIPGAIFGIDLPRLAPGHSAEFILFREVEGRIVIERPLP